MEYTQLKIRYEGRVAVMTICNPPRNGFSIRLIREMMQALDEFETDDRVRCVMLNSEGPDFSKGADYRDIEAMLNGTLEAPEEGWNAGALIEKIDNYPKPTLVAARGVCFGGSSAVFSAFDIRIAAENFEMHDGDIYYGTVGSWGMSSLRLPIWIGRNKVLDYMFLNESFTGRQCYELGLVSKVVPTELVDEIGLQIATKMAKAAPIAVRYYKECVRRAVYHELEKAHQFELEVAEIVGATEDCKNGLAGVITDDGGRPDVEFFGR